MRKKDYFKILIVCLLAVGGVFPWTILQAGPAGAELTLPQIIGEIQGRYEATSDFRARFIQESFLKAANRTEIEEGTVYFKHPKRMRWEYTRPKGKLLVINPEKTWLFLPEDKLVYLQETERMIQSRLAVRFLTGLGRLSEDFEITRPTQKTDREGNHLLTLVPKDAALGIERFTLTVDKTNYGMRQITFGDFAGNTTRIEFRNLVFNPKLAEGLFQFRIPAGIDVMNLN